MSINAAPINPNQFNAKLAGANVETKTTSQFQNTSVGVIGNSAQNHLNALEELTKALGDKASAQFTQSKAKDMRQSNADRVEKIQQLMEMAFKVEKRNQLDELAADLLSGGKTDHQALRQKLQEFSDDVTEQYIGLLSVREQLSAGEGNEAILQLVNQQLAELERKYGQTLTLGVNTFIPTIEAANVGLDEGSQLRQFYADSVMDYQGTAAAFSDLIEKYGESRFETAVAFMLQALAADYEAQGSSIDKSQLSVIMKDMNRLKMLAAMFDQCNEVAQKLDQAQVTPRGLMQSVITINDMPWAEQADVERALNVSDLPLGTQINLLAEVRNIVNNIPHDAFKDPEQYGQCVLALEAARHAVIAIEEAL